MKVKHFNLIIGSLVFKALGDESRIRILFLLYKNKEMCIADLELVLNFTQTKISRHLRNLRSAGLVSYRKIDQWAFYSIKDELTDFTDLVFKYLGKDNELNHDLETYNTLFSNRELAVNKVMRDPKRWRP
jgi:ArsR family transcriptional regulator, arsenate/arsenite/antimonite-responsive transcriptional repressor